MRPLVIGVDARELLGARTGVGRFLGELMHRWTLRPDREARFFRLYTPEPLAMTVPPLAAEVRVIPGGRGTWWEQTTLNARLRRDAPDVFFAPAYTAPIGVAAPMAVAIHDVSFSRHPEWFRRREGMRRRWLTRHAARRAKVIFAGSEFSKGEIVDLYGVAPERIRVLRYGVTGREVFPEVHREPLVLYTGSIFNRRRLPDLLAAFARVVTHVPQARLVIVGDNRTWPPQDLGSIARGLGVGGRVSLLRYVSDDELGSLYARASVFAFLSEYEGFGLTPLEALMHGVPIVVLDTPIAREIYGDVGAFVPKGDIDAAASAIVRLLTTPAARAGQLERAAALLAQYSWDATADQVLRELEGIAQP